MAVKYKKPLLVGTTGLKEEHYAGLEKLAKDTVIVTSANASLGVNILKSFVKKLASILDSSYDIEIVEMHHRNKVDSPSGTALILGKAAAEGRQINLDEMAIKERDGIIGKREEGKIGFATLRGGDVIGDHTVIFAGNGERIELTHKATSRELFVTGVMKIISWVKDVKPGKLYGMDDVLGL
ncbi:MAG: 4-hydroxy-tetrahydrodipicolinate reductase [Alphaproteobacteria bacterium ADurb.Bin438]|nr:MAG: 4-hydroxy-tetrahydrodipicolinate reductase [Alphaproteobacteria bacterium ADurb.Bin438]